MRDFFAFDAGKVHITARYLVLDNSYLSRVASFPYSRERQTISLMVNREAVGMVEAKPSRHSLMGVKEQSAKYLTGVDDDLPVAGVPWPFQYETTGQETHFSSKLNPVPRNQVQPH